MAGELSRDTITITNPYAQHVLYINITSISLEMRGISEL